MKKVLAIILCLSLVFAFAACGKGKEAKKITSADDLPGAVIGVQLGTTGDIYASDYEKEGSKIDRFNKGGDAILALSKGKIDCVIIDNEPAKAFVAANKGLKILEEPFANEDYAICIKKGSDLTQKFNDALKELKAEGVVDQVVKNYIGDDTKGTCPYVSPADITYPNGELHMATNAFFEPYEFYDKDVVVGIDAEIAKAICDKLGYKLVIDDMDFDSIITAVQTGMTVTDERKEKIDFTDSYATGVQVIVVKE